MPLLFTQAYCRAAAIVALLLTSTISHAVAADLIVLTAGAFKPVLLALAPEYEAKSHDTLAISNDTSGGVTARVARGEEIDLVILPTPQLDALAAQGKIAAGSVVLVAKVGIGVAVKKGTPTPDISTVQAFKSALLAAPSIAYIDPASGGSSGIYLTKLFDKLGIGSAIQRKVILVPGGLVGSRVDNGEAALGLQQMSELRVVTGVTVVGPLPAEIQNYTTYAAGIPTAARRPAAGRALLAYLRGAAGANALAGRGLELP